MEAKPRLSRSEPNIFSKGLFAGACLGFERLDIFHTINLQEDANPAAMGLWAEAGKYIE
jgi:hypothetical protein